MWTGLIPDIYSRSGVKSPKNIIYQGLNWRTENQAWGAWHKKNSYSRHVKSCFDVEYESNDIGARDIDKYLKDFPKDSIVALGDSFVEGYGLNHEETFTAQLQKKISKKVLILGLHIILDLFNII